MRDAVAIIAAPYGFGPSSKAIAISSYLPRGIERVFVGDGPALEMAARSAEFSSCARLDFAARDPGAAALLHEFKVVIFVNSTRFIPTAKARRRNLYILVDTLAWLRREAPSCADSVTAYFAQRFFDHPFAPELEAIDCFCPVGPIVPKTVTLGRVAADRYFPRRPPVIHCGGLWSPAMQPGADITFARELLKAVGRMRIPVRVILPKHLHSSLERLPAHVSLIDCTPLTVADHVAGSAFSLTTSGIEFTYESMLLDVPTLFLPPFNATQRLQLQYHSSALSHSLPFTLEFRAGQADHASLDDATRELQQDGLGGLWQAQFEQVAAFLDGYSGAKNCSTMLRRVRREQVKAIGCVGADGAQTIAAHAARQLEAPARLQ